MEAANLIRIAILSFWLKELSGPTEQIPAGETCRCSDERILYKAEVIRAHGGHILRHRYVHGRPDHRLQMRRLQLRRPAKPTHTLFNLDSLQSAEHPH